VGGDHKSLKADVVNRSLFRYVTCERLVTLNSASEHWTIGLTD